MNVLVNDQNLSTVLFAASSLEGENRGGLGKISSSQAEFLLSNENVNVTKINYITACLYFIQNGLIVYNKKRFMNVFSYHTIACLGTHNSANAHRWSTFLAYRSKL